VRIVVNEQNIPRVQLVGTWIIVVILTLVLGAYFVWRGAQEHQASLERIAYSATAQQESLLASEMDSTVSYIEFTRQRTEDILRRSLRDQVDTAMQIAESIYKREIALHPAAEVRKKIVEALRYVRFYEGRGYYFIDDLNGQFILLPTAPKLEGQTKLDNQDDQGHYIMRGLIDAAKMPVGEGYSRYRWYAPDNPAKMADKLAYVRLFAPFNWLIGTGDYTYKWEQLQKYEAISRLRAQRFGKSGHVDVLDRDGQYLLASSDPSLEGKRIDEIAPNRRLAVRVLLGRASQGGGLVHYAWPPAPGARPEALDEGRTAMVRTVAPWGWTLVVSVQDDELQSTLQAELAGISSSAATRWGELLLALAAALLLGLLSSYLFARWLRELLARFNYETQANITTIRESEALFRAVFDNAAVGIAQLSPQGKFLQINQHLCDLLGYRREEILDSGMGYQDITQPEDRANNEAEAQRMLRGEIDDNVVEKRYLHKSSKTVWVNVSAHLLRGMDGAPLYFITAVQDISARKLAEDRLKLAASVFSHSHEAIMITDPQGTIIEVNDAFTRITGYSREEAIGQNPRILKSGRQSPEYYAAMWHNLRENGHWSGEVWNRRKNGQIYAELQTVSAVRDAQGVLQNYVALFTDITPMMEHHRQLEHIAHYDALTDLPNRMLLGDRLQQAIAQSQRRGQSVAVVYLDLDGFKAINDTCGHDAGDQFLIALAGRLKATLREGDTLARIGGDEFVAVLVGLDQVQECEPVLRRLLQVASEKLQVGSMQMQVSASIGVTVYPTDGAEPDLLMRHADQAMYQAKQAGKNRFQMFDLAHDVAMQSLQERLMRLKQALERGEFELYYQPKVNMRTRRVVGAEALVRWQHPQQGTLAPGAFLPDLEDNALGVTLGEWVIANALRQMDQWQQLGLQIPVSVNIAANQLQQVDFTERLQMLLREQSGVSAQQLQLEVLETSALLDITLVGKVMNDCRAIGVGFALDDFGTGYSSLTYLRHLPAETLKIDQSFVRDMLEDASDLAIVEGVIGLAKAFGRSVIAEGVETARHGNRLLEMGCELAQGYGIARPMPAAEVPDWVARWHTDAKWKA